MRISIPQSLFSEHLQVVARAVPTKSPIPALEGILLQSDGNTMTITASNMEMGIRTSFPVAHAEPGSVVVPAKIVEIARRLPSESVHLTVNPENHLSEIKSGNSEFTLYGLPGEDYPTFPGKDREAPLCSLALDTADLRRVLRQTLFAVSHDEGKAAFTGIHFSLKGNTLYLSSSDTFRLAHTSCQVTNKAGQECQFLVPGKVLQEIARVFADKEGIVQLDLVKNQLLLACGNTEIYSRLLDESYPEVERVIPREFVSRATVETALFQNIVERALLLAEGSNHIIRLSFGDNCVVFRAASKFGKIQEQMPLVMEGEDMELALNARFLLDMLRICEGDKCHLFFTGQNRPCIMKDDQHEDYLYLVLPIKT